MIKEDLIYRIKHELFVDELLDEIEKAGISKSTLLKMIGYDGKPDKEVIAHLIREFVFKKEKELKLIEVWNKVSSNNKILTISYEQPKKED